MTALLLTVLGCSSLVLLPRVQWGGKRGAAQHRCSSFMVSERHNQAYKESIKLYAALEPSSPMPATLELVAHTPIETMYHQGHLVHETVRPLLRPDECQAVVDESEEWADRAGSTVLDYYCALLPSLSSTSSPTRTLLPRKVPHLPPPPPAHVSHSILVACITRHPPAPNSTSRRLDVQAAFQPPDHRHPVAGAASDTQVVQSAVPRQDLPDARPSLRWDAPQPSRAPGRRCICSQIQCDGWPNIPLTPSRWLGNYPPITLQLPFNCPPIALQLPPQLNPPIKP